MSRYDHFPALAVSLIFLVIVLTIFMFKFKTSPQFLATKSQSSPAPTLNPETNSVVTPTLTPSTPQLTTPSATSQAKTQLAGQISNLIYPGSSVNTQSSNSLTLKSSGNPESITDWYKDKIKQMGSKASSFASTNTNGNVLNKLVGNTGNMEIRVEVKKQSSESQTTIYVSLN